MMRRTPLLLGASLMLALLAGCGPRGGSDLEMAGHYVLDEAAFEQAVGHDMEIALRTVKELAPDWKPAGAEATATELGAVLREHSGITVDIYTDLTFRMNSWGKAASGDIQKRSFGGMWASTGDRIHFSVDREDQRRDPSVGYRYKCKRTMDGFVLRHRGIWPMKKVGPAEAK